MMSLVSNSIRVSVNCTPGIRMVWEAYHAAVLRAGGPWRGRPRAYIYLSEQSPENSHINKVTPISKTLLPGLRCCSSPVQHPLRRPACSVGPRILCSILGASSVLCSSQRLVECPLLASSVQRRGPASSVQTGSVLSYLVSRVQRPASVLSSV